MGRESQRNICLAEVLFSINYRKFGKMKTSGYLLAFLFAAVLSLQILSAQTLSDRKDVRRGNRDFRKENYKEAEINYRKALVKDSTSFAANYNLGNALYRMNDFQQAGKSYEVLKSSASGNPGASDLFYNMGNVAVQAKDWQAAVDSYKQSLLRNPSDLDAKENYIYARKMLENQQNQQNKQNNNKDNQDNQDNQSQNQDQDKKQDQDQKQDQNQSPDKNRQDTQSQQSESKITPQAAQQMLQAIQAKEKETQEKVKKEKAQALKSRQKEKNW